jgi:hypothetical protein
LNLLLASGQFLPPPSSVLFKLFVVHTFSSPGKG